MPEVPPLERPPWVRTGTRVVRKDDPLKSLYTIDTMPRKVTSKTTFRLRDAASGNIDQITYGEFIEHFIPDPRPEHRKCEKLDKWGEYNCERAKDHERNTADAKARVHRARVNHVTFEWRGRGEAKEVGRASVSAR